MSSESKELQDIANKLRMLALNSVIASKFGHITSCSSIAEILSVLFFKVMRYKTNQPRDLASDRLVLSKGHAAPILYAAWAEVGLFPREKLINLRTLYSDLEGHPTPRLNFIDVATGSLGQGLSLAAGMAYVGKKIDQANYRIYCIIGDGESAEGAVWEAVNFSGHYKLNNLCIIVDVNRLGQTGPTVLAHDLETYKKRFESFDCNTIIVDGHSVEELLSAFDAAVHCKDKPTILIAKTIKGKNFLSAEDTENWCDKIMENSVDKFNQHLESLISNKESTVLKPLVPEKDISNAEKRFIKLSTSPDYNKNDNVSTDVACATGLVKIVQNHPKIIVLDTDVCNLTFSCKVKEYDESRFIQCFLSEQNAIGVAIGAACRDRTIPFVSMCSAFLTKTFDLIRMGAISQTNINICGSQCGLSAGEDGPSSMGLEDLAMFRSIPGCTIFYPSDAVSCERAVELAANTKGITYIRTSTYTTPVIYSKDKSFRIGESQILKRHQDDKLLIVCGGITATEALVAQQKLDAEGMHVRIMDIFTVKPIDKEGIIKNAKDVGGTVITVEDHYAEGGLGEAVLSAVSHERDISVKVMAVPKIPRSGKTSELLDYFGISSDNIMLTIQELFGSKY